MVGLLTVERRPGSCCAIAPNAAAQGGTLVGRDADGPNSLNGEMSSAVRIKSSGRSNQALEAVAGEMERYTAAQR